MYSIDVTLRGETKGYHNTRFFKVAESTDPSLVVQRVSEWLLEQIEQLRRQPSQPNIEVLE